MGGSFDAGCKNCGAVFNISIGGGFTFALLHCERCGKPHSRPFRMPLPESDERLELSDGPDVCECGGRISNEGVPRCPECRSPDYDVLGNHIEYD